MASSRAVATSFKMLSGAFAGPVDLERIELYRAALDDLTDEQLMAATTIVIKTHTGDFIPPPAVLRKAVAPAPVAVDAAAIIRHIEKLAAYNPNVGMIYPPTSVVHDQLGEAVAYAYAAAGGRRLFAGDETGQSIAAREFQRAMAEAASRPMAALPLIDARTVIGETDPKVISLVDATTKRLAAGRGR